jgi:hypothetical protein
VEVYDFITTAKFAATAIICRATPSTVAAANAFFCDDFYFSGHSKLLI